MFFASDNWAGAHEKIADAMKHHATGFDVAYGAGALDREVEERFAEIFEHEVSVWFLPTGTACNSLAIAAMDGVGGVAFAHAQSHVREDEGGAPEFLTGGARIRPLHGNDGKFTAETLRRELKPFVPGSVNRGPALGVSITQATEIGTLYSLDEIAAIASVCREANLPLHMDGARFANALVALGCSPAEMTWRNGVDMLSFGATKNGCWCAEALVFFDPEKARHMHQLRKRSGHLFSKSRFVAAQFLAYFEGGLWLDLARHANAMATDLAAAVNAGARTRLAWPVEANEVFAVMPTADFDRLKAEGAEFHPWPKTSGDGVTLADDETITRLVTSFATQSSEIERFGALLG